MFVSGALLVMSGEMWSVSILSTQPRSRPALPLAFLLYSQRTTALRFVSANERRCQPASPEMFAASAPLIMKRSRSALVCEETFHQNAMASGPPSIVV